jgi:hypothetical protein
VRTRMGAYRVLLDHTRSERKWSCAHLCRDNKRTSGLGPDQDCVFVSPWPAACCRLPSRGEVSSIRCCKERYPSARFLPAPWAAVDGSLTRGRHFFPVISGRPIEGRLACLGPCAAAQSSAFSNLQLECRPACAGWFRDIEATDGWHQAGVLSGRSADGPQPS